MAILRRLFHSKLARGSLIILFAQNITNGGNFLFNLLMGRMLSYENYASMGALFSFLSIVNVPLAVFSLYVVKEVSRYFGRREISLIKIFFNLTFRKVFLAGLVSCLLFAVLGKWIFSFLRISDLTAVFIAGVILMFSFPSSFQRAVLQGMLYFPYIAVNSITEISVKIIVSVTLVFLEFHLLGALLGPAIGSFVSLTLSAFEIRLIFRILKYENIKRKIKVINFTSLLPVFFTSLILALFFNMGVIMVKHFFTPSEAGIYVALVTVGRIVYFATGPVLGVMFPVVNSRLARGESYLLPLLGTMVLSLLTGFLFILFVYLAPSAPFRFLYGGKYLEASRYITFYGFFMLLYSLNAVLTYFLLSLSDIRQIAVLFAISLTQTPGIFFFHSSIMQVIGVDIAVSTLYFFTASFFVFKREGKYIMNKLGKANG